MDRSCMIISGGDYAPIPQPADGEYVFVCDRGFHQAQRSGITPNLVVSDFDSYAGKIAEGIEVRRFRSEKDDTDTLIAIRTAIDMGFTRASLYCALGGRLDHTLANLQSAVFAAEHGLDVRILSPDTEIYTLRNGTLRVSRREGFSLSIFAAAGLCRGVSIRGAKYELDNVGLCSSFPLGVSNEWSGDAAVISVKEGVLQIVLSRL